MTARALRKHKQQFALARVIKNMSFTKKQTSTKICSKNRNVKNHEFVYCQVLILIISNFYPLHIVNILQYSIGLYANRVIDLS